MERRHSRTLADLSLLIPGERIERIGDTPKPTRRIADYTYHDDPPSTGEAKVRQWCSRCSALGEGHSNRGSIGFLR
jgi:hypothetical protein